MSKFISVCKFIKILFYGTQEENEYKLQEFISRENIKLDSELKIRCNKKDLEVWKAYANYNNITLSEYARDSLNYSINELIVNCKADNVALANKYKIGA